MSRFLWFTVYTWIPWRIVLRSICIIRYLVNIRVI